MNETEAEAQREAETLRRASQIIRRRARKPDSVRVRVIRNVIDGLADEIEDGKR